jgi:hypothetical protein
MKHLMTVLALSVACLSTSAFATSHKEAPGMKKAADKPMSACETQAADKKLAGAAKNSFVKKCEKDSGGGAKAACETQAGEKKLAGAAKNSFVKKCAADAGKA